MSLEVVIIALVVLIVLYVALCIKHGFDGWDAYVLADAFVELVRLVVLLITLGQCDD